MQRSGELHALQAAHAERRETVVVLQAAELTLDSTAPVVEVAETVGAAWDERRQTPSVRRDQDWLVRPACLRNGL